MLIQIAFLSKLLTTTIDWTLERFFLGVRSEVIEEIVPFFEVPFAVFVLAEEHLTPALALILEVSHILKSSQTWNI